MIVVFDLDDTLFSEFDFCRSAYHAIANECSSRYNLDAEEIFDAMMQAVLSHLNPFDALLEIFVRSNHSVSDFDIKEWVEKYRRHSPDYLPLAQDVALVFNTLKASEAELAIITDGRINTQTAKYKALGLEKFVNGENLIISEATGHDKKSDFNFKLLMSNYPGEEFVYVGDNPAKDFYYPNLLGWHTICIIPTFPTVHPFIIPENPMYRADLIINSFSDLLKDYHIASNIK